MKLPKSLQNVIDSFESLPGIGPKSAQRLAFYLLRVPQEELDRFASSFENLKKNTRVCRQCFNIGEDELCSVCADNSRGSGLICVVETPLDVLAIERSNYKGVYHVLHGVINPLAGIGPDEIFIDQLLSRLEVLGRDDAEVILATSTSLEGESTAMYIYKQIKTRFPDLKVSRIGKGLPIGADIEYADEGTLGDALKGRVLY